MTKAVGSDHDMYSRPVRFVPFDDHFVWLPYPVKSPSRIPTQKFKGTILLITQLTFNKGFISGNTFTFSFSMLG